VRHRPPARPRRPVRRGRTGWRAWFPLFALLGLLLLAPALVRAQGAGPDSVTLRWTAVGDDSLVGTAAGYDLRMSESPITESSWSAATALGGLPVPLASGALQQVIVRGLTPGSTYYFALRVRDDAGNWSGVSNLVRWDGVLDGAPPPAPSGLVTAAQGNGLHLSWAPSSAPDLAGYSVYRATAQAGPYMKLTPALLTLPEYQDDALPTGADSLWYEVTATNTGGTESARSAGLPSATPGTPVARARALPVLAWAIEPAYPNPSRASETVSIPVDLVDAAAARVDIVDAAGHLVWRSNDLQDLEVGLSGHTEVKWKGTNDAGRAVAPGPYQAWLVAGGARRNIRLVRVP
jgi:hypothetical protein